VSTITPTKTAPAGNWSADPVHSNLSFEIDYAGTNTFRGSFHEYSAGLSDGVLEGTAKVTSVDVKDEQLNGHLQSPDFFDAQRYPEITFKATELSRTDGDHVSAKGELTIKGVTHPITLEGTVSPAPTTDPFGREKIGLTLTSEIDRTEYGINWNAPNQSGGDYLANDVKLVADLVLIKAAE
jgi:polyisoprenoid-binding protein YceI